MVRSLLSGMCFVLIVGGAAVPQPLWAQREERPSPIDWWDHTLFPNHIDTFVGRIVVASESSGRVVVAVDLSATGEPDGQADHLFIFKAGDNGLGERQFEGMGTVRFWHEGLRVSLPEVGENIQLDIGDTAPPRIAARQWGPTTLVVKDGIGIAERSGPAVEQLEMDGLLTSLKVDDCESTGMCLDYQDYSSSGGGGGSCARSCSISCARGSCSVTCDSRGSAACRCSDPSGYPVCACNNC